MAKPTGSTDGTWLKALDLKSFMTPRKKSTPEADQLCFVHEPQHQVSPAKTPWGREESSNPCESALRSTWGKMFLVRLHLRKPAKLVDYILIWQFCPNQISEIRVSNSYFSFISQPIQPAQVFFIFFLASCTLACRGISCFLKRK